MTDTPVYPKPAKAPDNATLLQVNTASSPNFGRYYWIAKNDAGLKTYFQWADQAGGGSQTFSSNLPPRRVKFGGEEIGAQPDLANTQFEMLKELIRAGLEEINSRIVALSERLDYAQLNMPSPPRKKRAKKMKADEDEDMSTSPPTPAPAVVVL